MNDARQTTQDEIANEERKRNRQIKADAELLQALIKHPGWAVYMKALEAVGNNFNQELMKPLENTFQVTKTEFAKGALTGIQAAASLPHAKIREVADLKLTDD